MTTTVQAHEWKRTRTHVQSLGAIANGLDNGLLTPERAAELLRQLAGWLVRDVDDLEAQAKAREDEQFEKGVAYSEWLGGQK